MCRGVKSVRAGVAVLCILAWTRGGGAEVILDDGQPGTTSTGLWSRSAAPGPYGGRSLYAHAVGATYTFTIPVPEPGAYEVALWWTSYVTRYRNVHVEVAHADGMANLYVDQRYEGSRWNTLGAFPFNAEARVTVHSAGVDSTCADAVRLVPAAAPYFQKVIDNGRAGTSRTGAWALSSGPNPYGRTSIYAKQKGATYSYRFDLPEPGDYEVLLWWTSYPSRSSSVPVLVSGVPETVVDQTRDGGLWNSIGTFSADTILTVTIVSPGGASTCADAVKIVALYGEPPTLPDPIAYWSLDEGEGILAHDVVGGHDADIHGATWEPGRYGPGLRFDGVDDYLAAAGTFSLDALTFAAWVHTDPVNLNNNRIITLHDGVDSYYYHFDVETNSANAIQVYYGFSTVNDYKWPLPSRTWIHVAVTYDGQKGQIFLNGRLIGEGPLPSAPRSGSILIGGVDQPSHYAQAWDGLIDDVVIFDRALTPAEVSRLYTEGVK